MKGILHRLTGIFNDNGGLIGYRGLDGTERPLSRMARIVSSAFPSAVAVPTQTNVDVGSLLDTVLEDTEGNSANPTVSFTGAISGTTLTVSGMTGAGWLVPNQCFQGAGVTNQTLIVAQLTGTPGGNGTYTIAPSQTVASTPMLSCAVIIVPPWAKYVSVTGHLGFPQQNTLTARASIHLWRNGGATSEAFYHSRVAYAADLVAANNTSIFGSTGGKIPVMFPGEIWSLVAWQSTGVNQNMPVGQNQWLKVEFFDN